MTNCSEFFMKRCYLLYVFVAIAVALLLVCLYLYRKYTKQVEQENRELDEVIIIDSLNEDIIMEEKNDNGEVNEEVKGEVTIEVEEKGDGVPDLIRSSSKNEEECEKVKENDKEIENVIIETIEEEE